MTAMGIAMVVAVFVMTLAIAQGFRATLVASGSPQNAIVLRKGATSETVSAVLRAAAADHRERCRRSRAAPTAVRWRRRSWSSIISLPRHSDNQPANVPVRGVGPQAFDVRDTLKIRRGAPLHAGHARDQRRRGWRSADSRG